MGREFPLVFLFYPQENGIIRQMETPKPKALFLIIYGVKMMVNHTKNRHFKRVLQFTALLCVAALLTGCGAVQRLYLPGHGGSENQQSEKVSPPPTGEDPSAYLAVYRQIVADMIDQYGEFCADPDTQVITGLKYGELIDFENDGVPELLLLCDQTAYLYRYDGAGAAQLLCEPVGISFGCTDVSYYIHVSEAVGKTYLIVDHSTDGWTEDDWTAYTVEAGALRTVNYFARTDGYNDYPDTEFLVNCKIDGNRVSAEDYLTERDLLRKGSRTIDAIWDFETARYEELQQFEASLE